MVNLATSFAGIELKNPIVVASSGLTSTVGGVVEMAHAGAAAVVLKSLFEEDIIREVEHLSTSDGHTEMDDYLQGYMLVERLREYVTTIAQCKAQCNIPVVASICCCSRGEWVDFAREVARAGADALELNIMALCADRVYTDGEYEHRHCEIVGEVTRLIDIPVIVKLGAHLSNPVNLAERLGSYGASGVVFFNRPYQPDIDIERMKYRSGSILSHTSDFCNPLRWVGLASASVANMPFALSGGVHSADAVVKALLAGASAVEVCSVLYEKGIGWISSALQFVDEWCSRHGFGSVSEFRGRMSAEDVASAEHLERMQFLRYVDEG